MSKGFNGAQVRIESVLKEPHVVALALDVTRGPGNHER